MEVYGTHILVIQVWSSSFTPPEVLDREECYQVHALRLTHPPFSLHPLQGGQIYSRPRLRILRMPFGFLDYSSMAMIGE